MLMNSQTNFIWLDLEMTGLDPEKDVILQIAIVATNSKLQELDAGIVCCLTQPVKVLNGMSEWCLTTHKKTGLFDQCLVSTTSLQEAEKICLAYVTQHTKKGESPLCGNSIGQDRRFLYRYMPTFSQFLHYRNLDVSSFKILKEVCYPQIAPFSKKGVHDALADLRESILELKYYKEKLFKRRFT